MQNEIIFDYNNMQGASELLPVEDEDGNKSSDYIDIPISDGKEKVVTESHARIQIHVDFFMKRRRW